MARVNDIRKIQVEAFAIVAKAHANDPAALGAIVRELIRSGRVDYLKAAIAAGFLATHSSKSELGYLVLPLLSSTNPSHVTAAIDWLRAADALHSPALSQALRNADSHHKELIELGANPNDAPPNHTSALGQAFLRAERECLITMVTAVLPALPMLNHRESIFDVAFTAEVSPSTDVQAQMRRASDIAQAPADVPTLRSGLVECILDQLPHDDESLRASLATSTLRFSDRAKLQHFTRVYEKVELDLFLRMISRSGPFRHKRPNVWLDIFNTPFRMYGRSKIGGVLLCSKLIEALILVAEPERASEVLEKAMSEGFEIDRVFIQANNRSYAPLHFAAFSDRQEMVSRLLQIGANPGAPDSRGDSAEKVAAKTGRASIAASIAAFRTA